MNYPNKATPLNYNHQSIQRPSHSPQQGYSQLPAAKLQPFSQMSQMSQFSQ